ncbi:MAG: TIGR04211 family SH3 domain-containing protein [Desulfobacteraceae bacterium]|nr:TIGR04211 family SH3 domain-containing protein [Desulfobacteraceae bacterium]
MKKLFFPFIIFVMIICLFPQLVLAKTGYVSDMLMLTFRQGPGNSYAVAKTLKSNTPVSILEEKNEFYKVELQSKEIGWVDKNFIVFELPKIFIIDQLKQENKLLKDKISKLESLTQTLEDKILSQKTDYSQKTKKNKMYQEKNSIFSKEIELLKKKNEVLFKTDMIKWFLTGVGVLLLGWIIGQSVSSKKRQSRSSLLG